MGEMVRPLTYPMAALAAGMKARAGDATLRDGLSLTILFLGDDIHDDAEAAEALRLFLDGIQTGAQAAAGSALLDWVTRAYPADPAPGDGGLFDWQRRADCGL